MSSPSMDARAAAFAPAAEYPIVEWRGFKYEVRPPSLLEHEQIQALKVEPTRKSIHLVIACTYWPPETPPGEDGKERAGKPMFSKRDVDAIMQSSASGSGLWPVLIRKVAEVMRIVDTKEEVGNSEAIPSDTSA